MILFLSPCRRVGVPLCDAKITKGPETGTMLPGSCSKLALLCLRVWLICEIVPGTREGSGYIQGPSSRLMLPCLMCSTETQVEILESVRGKDVYIIQTGCG